MGSGRGRNRRAQAALATAHNSGIYASQPPTRGYYLAPRSMRDTITEGGRVPQPVAQWPEEDVSAQPAGTYVWDSRDGVNEWAYRTVWSDEMDVWEIDLEGKSLTHDQLAKLRCKSQAWVVLDSIEPQRMRMLGSWKLRRWSPSLKRKWAPVTKGKGDENLPRSQRVM